MYKLLKIVTNSFENENRDERELRVAVELGFEVMVMAKGNGKKNSFDFVNDILVHRCTTKPLGNRRILIRLNRIVSVFKWSIYAHKINADVISCHDILSLMIGYLSNFYKVGKSKSLLIYDSHEFELGRNVKRSLLTKYIIKHLENFLIKRSYRTMMVNDIIADEVQNIYKLPNRPVVIRNIPEKWVLNDNEIECLKTDYIRKFNLDSNPFIVMYHGRVIKGRGIEVMLKAIKLTGGTVGIILGNGCPDYISYLKRLIIELDIEERILFENAVSYKKLGNYIACADVGLVSIENLCKSYFYSLPNKYFENIQALTPVINSDFPAMKRITKEYNIGISTDCSKVENISKSIKKLMNDKVLYQNLKNNLIVAKNDLCWENERSNLVMMYSDVIEHLNIETNKGKGRYDIGKSER